MIKKIKIYVISNINPKRHDYIKYVTLNLDNRYEVFNPYIHNVYNQDQKKMEYNVFYKDKLEIDKCNISIVLLPLYGRDCAAEIGYSYGKNKCVISYIEEINNELDSDWLNDWMVKGFTNYIITISNKTYSILKKDLFFKQKERYLNKNVIFYIDNINELSEKVYELFCDYQNTYII